LAFRVRLLAAKLLNERQEVLFAVIDAVAEADRGKTVTAVELRDRLRHPK